MEDEYSIIFLNFESNVRRRGNSYYALIDRKLIDKFRITENDSLHLVLHRIIKDDGKVEELCHLIKTG